MPDPMMQLYEPCKDPRCRVATPHTHIEGVVIEISETEVEQTGGESSELSKEFARYREAKAEGELEPENDEETEE